MADVTQRVVHSVFVEQCGRPESHSVECARIRLDAALAAYHAKRWVEWVNLRRAIAGRRCGCSRHEVDALRRCGFGHDYVDGEVDEAERVVVWTCPRCFADHFEDV